MARSSDSYFSWMLKEAKISGEVVSIYFGGGHIKTGVITDLRGGVVVLTQFAMTHGMLMLKEGRPYPMEGALPAAIAITAISAVARRRNSDLCYREEETPS